MTNTAFYKPAMPCPWGEIQSAQNVAPGIDFVQTAGHGGYRLSREVYNQMPQHLREYSFTKDQWFEEDCSWCAVVLAFPQHFNPTFIEAARQTEQRNYKP
jgi:N-acetyl-anhydromuramyl-L-alanine amidase AmpD